MDTNNSYIVRLFFPKSGLHYNPPVIRFSFKILSNPDKKNGVKKSSTDRKLIKLSLLNAVAYKGSLWSNYSDLNKLKFIIHCIRSAIFEV
jgi:hypothetical protein